MGVIGSYLLFAVFLFGPAVLIIIGWMHWRHVEAASMPSWRRGGMCAGLIAASAAWVLLAALELPMPYLRRIYGQPFVESFWRHSFPIGLILSLLGVLLGLSGRGRVRILCTAAALALSGWWYFLGLLE